MYLKSFAVGQAAKMSGALYAIGGLIGGVFFALMSLAGGQMWTGESAFVGAIFGVGAIIFLPVFYGLIGVLAGAIGATVYNWLAGMLGGFEIELE